MSKNNTNKKSNAKDYNKAQRFLLIIRALVSSESHTINDKKLRELLGNPERAGYFKLIKELTTNNGDVEALLTRKESDDTFIYYLNESYRDVESASTKEEFFIECYSRIGGILPEEMQKRLSMIADHKVVKSQKIKRKFCNIRPIYGRELDLAHKKMLSLAIKAILEEKEVVMKYRGADGNEAPSFIYQPLTLCLYREDLYLKGRILEGGKFQEKTCKVRRIQELKLTNTKFSYPISSKWNPQVENSLNSGIINRRHENVDVVIKVFGDSRIAFQDKVFFNSKFIATYPDFDIYELTCTAHNEFIGQLFVYAQDIEIVNNDEIKNLFKEKARKAIKRNS